MTVLAFFLLIGFVFWITSLHDRPDFDGEKSHPERRWFSSARLPRELEGRRRT